MTSALYLEHYLDGEHNFLLFNCETSVEFANRLEFVCLFLEIFF